VLRAADRFSGCRIVKLLYHRFDREAFLNCFVTHLQSVTPANCSISLRLKPCLIFSKSMNAFKFISALCPQEKLRTSSLAIYINIAIHSPSNRVECYSTRLLHHSYRNPSILHKAYGCRQFLPYNFCPSTVDKLMKKNSEKKVLYACPWSFRMIRKSWSEKFYLKCDFYALNNYI